MDIAAENRARMELERTRTQITSLNAQVAVNNRLAVDANAERRQTIQQINRRLRAEQGLLRVQAQRQSALLPGLREEIRATTNAVRETGRLDSVFSSLGGSIASIGIDLLTTGIVDFTRGAVNAATTMEGLINAFTGLTGSAQLAEQRIRELQEVAQAPGVSFEQASQGAVRLHAVGVEAELADRAVIEVGNALALVGNTDFRGALLGLTQIASRGEVAQEEINQLVERSGIFSVALREAFGSINAEDIRAELESAGEGVDEFIQRFVDALGNQARVATDSTVNAISNLNNAVFELQAAIGEGLTPVARDAAVGLTGFFNTITGGIRDLQELSGASETVTRSVFDTNAAFSDRDSLVAYVQSLRDLRESQQELVDQGAWWQYTGEAQEGVEELTEWIMLYEQALQGIPTAQETLRSELEATNAQYTQQQQSRIDLLSSLKEERESIFGNVNLYQDQYDANEEAITQNRAKAQVLQNIINALDDTTEAENEATESARLAAIVQSVLQDSYTMSADAAKALATGLRLVREQLTENREEQEQLNQFWQLASGQISDYSDALETTIPSVVNLESEQQALQDAFQNTFEGFDDPLADYVAGLDATSDAADETTGHLNRVGETIRQTGGDASVAEARLSDFDDAFQLSEATIPRVTSAMREFTGTAPDVDRVTEAVERSTRSVEDLLDEIDAVGDGTEAIGAIETAFLNLADHTIPDVTRDIVDAFVAIAEGDDINDAFGRLGERVGNTLIDEMSAVLSDQLSGAVIGNLQGVDVGGIGSAITGAASALASPIALFTAGAVAFTFAAEGLAGLITPEGQGPDRTLDPGDPNRLVNVGGAAGLDLGLNFDFGQPIDFSNIDTDLIQQLLELPDALDEAADASSRIRITNISTFDTAGDRERTEAIASAQYGPDAYEAEVASAMASNDEIVVDATNTLDELSDIADRNLQIRLRAEEVYRNTVQDIYNDVASFYERTQDRIADISERAALDRADAEMRYQDTLQDIYNDVAGAFEDAEAQKTAIAERVNDMIISASMRYQDTLQDIYNDVADAFEDAESDKLSIRMRVDAELIDASMRYQDTLQDIYNDVADAFEDAEAQKTAIAERATADRLSAEMRYADRVQSIANMLVDDVRGIHDQITDAEMQAVDDRLDAYVTYDMEVQGIYNDLASEILSIEENLSRDLDRIGDQRLASEERRIEALNRLNRGRAEDAADLERQFRRDIEDLLRDERITARGGFDVSGFTSRLLEQGFQTSEGTATEALGRFGFGADLTAPIAEFLRQFGRDTQDLGISTARQRGRISEGAARDAAGFTAAETAAREGAAGQIAEAEMGAGTTAAEALANAVPPLDAMSMASMNLATTLTTIDENLATDVGLLNAAITMLETDAGISFEDALTQYTPSLSAMAQAGQDFADAIAGIDSQELADIGAVNTTLNRFIDEAGVPLSDALNFAEPPMSRLATALETLNTDVGGIQTQGETDIASVDATVNRFITDAGVPLADALRFAETPMTRLATALETLNTDVGSIQTQGETDIASVDATVNRFITDAGVPLADALRFAETPMTRLATALETLDTDVGSIQQRGAEDTADVDTRLGNIIELAGVDLPTALANAEPPLTRFQVATDTLATSLGMIDAQEIADIAEATGALDTFVMRAGVDLPTALANAEPPMTRLAEAAARFQEVLNPEILMAGSEFRDEVNTAGGEFRSEIQTATRTLVSGIAAAIASIPTGSGTVSAQDVAGQIQQGIADGSITPFSEN